MFCDAEADLTPPLNLTNPSSLDCKHLKGSPVYQREKKKRRWIESEWKWGAGLMAKRRVGGGGSSGTGRMRAEVVARGVDQTWEGQRKMGWGRWGGMWKLSSTGYYCNTVQEKVKEGEGAGEGNIWFKRTLEINLASGQGIWRKKRGDEERSGNRRKKNVLFSSYGQTKMGRNERIPLHIFTTLRMTE